MDKDGLNIRVECYSGYRGEETPRRFYLAERAVEVTEVVQRWLTPDYRYFKVRGSDGVLYVLRHDNVSSRWDMTAKSHG